MRKGRPSELGRSTLSKQISSPEAAFSLLARARANYAKQHARKEEETWAGLDETCGGYLKVNMDFSSRWLFSVSHSLTVQRRV